MPNPRIEVIIAAVTQGFDTVTQELRNLEQALRGVQASVPVVAVQQLTQQMSQLSGQVNTLTTSINTMNTATRQGRSGFVDLGWTIASFRAGIEKLIAVQLRWYAARALIFGPLRTAWMGTKEIVEYAAQLDQARAEMLRWEATSGVVSDKVQANTDRIMLSMRKALTEYPLTLKQLSDSVQAFIGAGVSYNTVAGMVPDIARLKTAFKEINFNEFAKAVTGAFNVFKKELGEGLTDAEKFSLIFDKILRAQAVGVIRPEEFTKVLQYLSATGKQAGFTLDQILAMATAITNTGIPASSASRLMAGLMTNLTQGNVAAKMKDIGYTLKANVPLAQQFDDIVLKLKEHLGSGGPVTAGWMGWLADLMRAERVRNLVAFLDQFGKYKKLVTDIAGAAGGLTLGADIMKMTIPAQWQIFQNVLREIGVNATVSGASLNKMLGVVVEISRGILAAVDTTGIWADKLDKLGTAGKVAYSLIKGLQTGFELIGVAVNIVLAPFKMLLSLLELIGGEVVALKAYFSTLTGALTGGLLGGLLGAAAGAGRLAVGLAAVRTAIVWLITWGLPALWAALGPIGRILMIGNAIFSLFESLKNSYKESQPEGQAEKKLAGMGAQSDKELRQQLEVEKARLADLQKEKSDMEASGEKAEMPPMSEADVLKTGNEIEGYLGDSRLGYKNRQIKASKDVIAAWEEELRKRKDVADEEEKLTKGKPEPGKETRGVTSARMFIGVENKEYNLAMQQIRNYEQEQTASYDRMQAYGIISEEDYYQMREGLSRDTLAKEENATFVHIENLKQLYGKLYAEEANAQARAKKTDPGKLGAIEAQRDAEIEAANTKMDNAIRQHWVQRERDQIQSLGRQRQQLTQYTNAMLAIWKGYFHTVAAVQLAYIDMQRMAVDYSYSINAISATKAHDEEMRLSNEETQTKIDNLNKQYAAQQRALQTEAGFKGSEMQTVSVNRTIAANAARHENELTNIKLDGEKQRLGIQLKYLKDAQWMYEAYYEGSLMKTLRHFLSIQLNEFERTGDQLKKIAESVATGMSDAFSTFFFDVYEGKVKELKDYTKQFADTVLKQAFSAISQQLTAFLLSPLKIILPELQLPGEAMKNMKTQLMNVTADVVNIIGKTAPPTGGGGEPGGVGPSGLTPMEAEKEQAQRDLNQVESIGPEGITYKSGYKVTEAEPAYATFGETQIPTGSPMEHLEAGSAEALAQETEELGSTITDALEEGGDTFTTLLDDSFTTGSDLFTSAFDSLKGLFSGMDFGSMFGGSGGGGGGSWWGDLLGMGASMFAGEAHEGKRGGETSTGVYRLAPAAAFSGAPRFHSGKGIAQDEMAAIIKKNEWVFPADKVVQGKSGGGSSSSLTISVPLTVNGGDPDLARRLPRVIENAVRNELQKRS